MLQSPLLRVRAPSARRAGRWTARSRLLTPRATARLRARRRRPRTRSRSHRPAARSRPRRRREPSAARRSSRRRIAARRRPALRAAAARERFASVPVRSDRDRARREAAGCQHHPARCVYVVVAAGVSAHRGHAVAVALDLDDTSADQKPAASGAERRAQRVVDTDPGCRGRQRRDLEHRMSEAALELRPGSVGVAKPDDRRQPDALVGVQQRQHLSGKRGTELGIVHAPCEPERVRLRASHVDLDLYGSRRDAVALEIRRAQRCVEVAQHAHPHHADRARRGAAPGGDLALHERLGDQRGRALGAQRTRQHVVA